jgi:hypothetical protein
MSDNIMKEKTKEQTFQRSLTHIPVHCILLFVLSHIYEQNTYLIWKILFLLRGELLSLILITSVFTPN